MDNKEASDSTVAQPEHQRSGDARRPGDTLDRDQEMDDREPVGGDPPENVEDRPNVGTVTPDD